MANIIIPMFYIVQPAGCHLVITKCAIYLLGYDGSGQMICWPGPHLRQAVWIAKDLPSLPFLRSVDRYLLEPMIRRAFPEPRARAVGVRIVRKGSGNWRILCLAGAFCGDTAANWSDWIADLGHRFPEADIAVVNGFYYYWPEDADVMKQIIAEGRMLLADRRPTVIIAFSFGGLLAKAMVDQPDHHGVRAIVTMATEHRGHLPRIAETRDVRLGIPLDVDVPISSFGGWLDVIVWPWTTFTDQSDHRFFLVGHFAFMRSAAVREKVSAVLQDIFF